MLLDKQGLMQGDCHWSGAMKISGRMQLSMANGLSSSRPDMVHLSVHGTTQHTDLLLLLMLCCSAGLSASCC